MARTRPGRIGEGFAQDALVQVIGCLNERDVAFTSIEIFEPNLESVFLHLTGKKLRE